MNVLAIVDLARNQTHVLGEDFPNADAIIYFNESYKKVCNEIITKVAENYFFQIWDRSANADQLSGEYPYPVAQEVVGVGIPGMSKLQKLAVKPTPDDDFVFADEVKVDDLPRDWSWYLENQPNSKPIYFIGGNSFFIAPQFKAENVDSEISQIKCYGSKKVLDLEIGDIEAAVLVPTEFHEVIALGIEPYIYKRQGLGAESNNAKNSFNEALFKMVGTLTDRTLASFAPELPNDYHLQY